MCAKTATIPPSTQPCIDYKMILPICSCVKTTTIGSKTDIEGEHFLKINGNKRFMLNLICQVLFGSMAIFEESQHCFTKKL